MRTEYNYWCEGKPHKENRKMFELGYKATVYYRDSEGCRILAKYRAKEHYPTEEEAIKMAEAEFPETIENNGIKAYRCEIEAKCYKYPTDTCPDGYRVCPRCYGTGVYDGASHYHDNQGVKYCFKCEGMGVIKLKKRTK